MTETTDSEPLAATRADSEPLAPPAGSEPLAPPAGSEPLAAPPAGSVAASLDGDGNLVIPNPGLVFEPGQTLTLLCAPVPGGSEAAARPGRRGADARGLAAIVLVFVLVTAVLAANSASWRWTGFAGNTALWSWLRLLVQPVALASLTVRLVSTERTWRAWRLSLLAGVAALTIVVIAGYAWSWSWTGFHGQALWDWLNLLLFPIVVVLLPEWVRRGEPFGPRAQAITAVVIVGFVILVLGGYDWGWSWTGFTGNNFRDWLDLMIAPFLLPISLKLLQVSHLSRLEREAAGVQEVRVELGPTVYGARRG